MEVSMNRVQHFELDADDIMLLLEKAGYSIIEGTPSMYIQGHPRDGTTPIDSITLEISNHKEQSYNLGMKSL